LTVFCTNYLIRTDCTKIVVPVFMPHLDMALSSMLVPKDSFIAIDKIEEHVFGSNNPVDRNFHYRLESEWSASGRRVAGEWPEM